MTDDEQPPEFEDEEPAETPFDPAEGIWFKYGRLYKDRDQEVGAFEAHCGFSLPEDFLDLIGEYCQGGFDGWYKVKEGPFGHIVWSQLLLMRLPAGIDLETEKLHADNPYLREKSVLAVKFLEEKRPLFYSPEGDLTFFPFGKAHCFHPTHTASDGFLAFDIRNKNHVVYLAEENPTPTPIAPSFSEMMHGAVFQFYG